MTAVADIFDRDGDGYIDYYEFVAALHPNKDAYRPTTDADKIEDEVWAWLGESGGEETVNEALQTTSSLSPLTEMACHH